MVITILPLVGLPVADDESVLSNLSAYMKQRTQLPLHVLKDQYGNQAEDWLERTYRAMLGHGKRKWPQVASVYNLHTNIDIRTTLEKRDPAVLDSIVFLITSEDSEDAVAELLTTGHVVSDPSSVRSAGWCPSLMMT
jgi:hypothetical protein